MYVNEPHRAVSIKVFKLCIKRHNGYQQKNKSSVFPSPTPLLPSAQSNRAIPSLCMLKKNKR